MDPSTFLEVTVLSYDIQLIGSEEALQNRIKNADILRLVTAYREHGYKNADIDPLNTLKRWVFLLNVVNWLICPQTIFSNLTYWGN